VTPELKNMAIENSLAKKLPVLSTFRDKIVAFVAVDGSGPVKLSQNWIDQSPPPNASRELVLPPSKCVWFALISSLALPTFPAVDSTEFTDVKSNPFPLLSTAVTFPLSAVSLSGR
jgi:hypothetical protein